MGQRSASTEKRTQRPEAAEHNTKRLRATGNPTHGAATISEESLGSTAAGHIGSWEAGTRDVRSSRKKTGSWAGSRPTVNCGRAARSFIVAGLTVGWLAADQFTAGLLAIVHEPGMVLKAAGQAKDISTAHICRAGAKGRGERNITGISEDSQAVVSRAGVEARHGEVL